ncbi:hypothetical protein CRM94_17140 [Burkholderia gladioli]|uniref:Uncharacterized protein n=1 Tax=Burkholderia gladioli TaxID=28095 RepID=A0A2A7SAD5_BURGA|nr:hypothetical protein [Burkholderia gladioli]PEH40442.1 hypothetical protein CRM94_17140 [Burkholderia gladioli]
MANNYYDMTGVLMLDSVTPIIRALFTAFDLPADGDAAGEVYIAAVSESSSHSWESVGDNIDNDLFTALGLKVDGFDNFTVEEKLQHLADHFKVSDKPEIVSFFEDTNFDEDADLDSLVMLAGGFDDGHGLTGYRIEGCWHCSAARLFEFGGHGDYLGKHFAVSESSNRIVSFGQRVDIALANGDVSDATKAISQHVASVIAGISDEVIRAQVLHGLITQLAPVTTGGWSPANGVMTDLQYTTYRGCRCPSCGDREQLSGQSFSIDAGTASQTMHCEACEASWSDSYRLIGYSDLEGGLDHEGINRVVADVKERGVAVVDAGDAAAAISDSGDELGVGLRQFEIDIAVSKLIDG